MGRAALTELLRVVMVSTVVTPRLTRAGAAPLLSQNDTQDITTIKLLGMYTWEEYFETLPYIKVDRNFLGYLPFSVN